MESSLSRAFGHPIGTVKTPLRSHRAAECFEELIDTSQNFESDFGSKPKVFLINIGSVKDFKARAEFSRSFFEVGGFEVISPSGFNQIEDAIESIVQSDTHAAVICSTDDKYPDIVPPLVNAIHKRFKDLPVILAGYPKNQIELYKEAGIYGFISPGCDAYEILSNLHRTITEIKSNEL